MNKNRSRMTRACRGWLPKLMVCLLGLLLVSQPQQQARAADVLLTGAEDSPGVQGFTSALARQRPEDRVRFVPFGQLPAPGQLPAGTRLILLDPPSLDWRLSDSQGPATLVLRISRLQAHQRLGQSLPRSAQPALERSAAGSAIASDTGRAAAGPARRRAVR